VLDAVVAAPSSTLSVPVTLCARRHAASSEAHAGLRARHDAPQILARNSPVALIGQIELHEAELACAVRRASRACLSVTCSIR